MKQNGIDEHLASNKLTIYDLFEMVIQNRQTKIGFKKGLLD